MSAISRSKGKRGEREIAALVRGLTGWDVRRRVRQHQGDSDLDGIPGWAPEVKRHATAGRADIAGWWQQAVDQAAKASKLPVLMFRVNRDEWRAVWPLAMHMGVQTAEMWTGYAWTIEGTLEAWAAVAREVVGRDFPPVVDRANRVDEGLATTPGATRSGRRQVIRTREA